MTWRDFTLDDAEDTANASEGATPGLCEPKIFARFFEAEWPRLKSYLSRFVGGDDAEEIAQEAFMRVYQARSEIRSPSGLLYATARNLVIDRQRQRRSAALVDADYDIVESIPDLKVSPEEQVSLRQRLEHAAVMLDRMPTKCREVFLLQIVDGCTYAEIAARLGISVVGVKKQLLRAFRICAEHAEAENRNARRGTLPKRTRGQS